ncbi:MAG: sensor histidine kinase [Dermatophilaceae bacterium]
MNRAAWLSRLDASAQIRMALALLCALVAGLIDTGPRTLPWLALVVVLDLAALVLDARAEAATTVSTTLRLGLLAVAAVAAGVAFAVADVGAALLVLIPVYHAGSAFGWSGSLLGVVAGGAGLLAAVGARDIDLGDRAVVEWLVAAVALGVLGVWNGRLSVAPETRADADPTAREAIELIQRLQDIAGQMTTGLDAPAGASFALDLLGSEVTSTRSAVLVAEDAERLVPVALRGATRAPWHMAEHVSALLRTNPAGWEPTEVRFVDELGRRRALVVPFAYGDGPTTVVVVERADDRPFGEAERRRVREVTQRVAPTVQAGLLFGQLKQYASLEERNRIARDIHDGIAQELAAFGYQLDALRAQAGPTGAPVRDGLDRLRERLGEAMADLRLHITDLRVAERPGTGLGAVLGGAVQSFGSVTGVRTTVTVSEARRRHDPRVEILIHRLVMDVLADAQASGARNAWVSLSTSVAGPACVDVSHDGDPTKARKLFRNTSLGDLDGALFVSTEPNGRTTVNLTVEEPTTVGANREAT